MSVLILMITLLPLSAFGQQTQDTPAVTGAGAGVFPSGTLFAAVPVSGLTFGMGVFIYSDGTAAGTFATTLLGTSILGQPQNIEVDATATAGVINADGTRTFSGTATLDMGDGTLALTNIPFTMTASTTSLLLVLNGLSLPSAPLTDGWITKPT